MKIIATTRTRNEEANVERFCTAYGSFCDEIIIADGGSQDRTVEIAESMPKTFVTWFDDRVWNPEKTRWRNPHGEHINFCISAAIDRGADWIIFDDCDDVPTIALQDAGRDLFHKTNEKVILAYRLYVAGYDHYYPKMNETGQSLWAWNTRKCMVWASESDPWKHEMNFPLTSVKKLDVPYSLLHYFSPDEETIQKKLSFYRESGQQPNAQHPRDFCGNKMPLPNWAVWK